MNYFRDYVTAALALLCFAAAPSSTFDLSGDGSRWHASISQVPVGKAYGMTFSQWSISLYRGKALAYRSPRDGGPLSKVTKAHGADIWFPTQDATIVGAARLMGDSAQQLVVGSHETGADCGVATITIFRYDKATSKVVPAVTVQNGCDLDAKISANTVLLVGPYYAANAPLCCPTKPEVTATLAYRNGSWTITPSYFAIHPNAFPHV